MVSFFTRSGRNFNLATIRRFPTFLNPAKEIIPYPVIPVIGLGGSAAGIIRLIVDRSLLHKVRPLNDRCIRLLAAIRL